jgi:hypothetical protein
MLLAGMAASAGAFAEIHSAFLGYSHGLSKCLKYCCRSFHRDTSNGSMLKVSVMSSRPFMRPMLCPEKIIQVHRLFVRELPYANVISIRAERVDVKVGRIGVGEGVIREIRAGCFG